MDIETKTIQQLQEKLNINADRAAAISGLIQGKVDPREYSDVSEWISQCFHLPRRTEQIMCAINQELAFFGVEPMTDENTWIDCYHGNIIATYCNAGDAYETTIVHDHVNAKFLIVSVADFLESREC